MSQQGEYEQLVLSDALASELGAAVHGSQEAWLVRMHDAPARAGQPSVFVVFSPQTPPLTYEWTFRREAPTAQLKGTSRSAAVIWVPRTTDAGAWSIDVKLKDKDQQDRGAASVKQPVELGDDDIDALTRVEPKELRIVPIGSGALFQRLYYQLLAELESVRASAGALGAGVSTRFMATYCYTALVKYELDKPRAPADSLLRQGKCIVERGSATTRLVWEAARLPAVAALSGNEREGVFGLQLCHAALYTDLIESAGWQFTSQRALETRFREIANQRPERIVELVNCLRFPRSCAKVFLLAVRHCMTAWKHLAASASYQGGSSPERASMSA